MPARQASAIPAFAWLVRQAHKTYLWLHCLPDCADRGAGSFGIAGRRVLFAGFLPARSGERRARLTKLRELPATLIFYEAPHRIAATLPMLAKFSVSAVRWSRVS